MIHFYGINYEITKAYLIQQIRFLNPSNFSPDDSVSDRAHSAHNDMICEPDGAFFYRLSGHKITSE